jgi:hypothetical protein
MREICHGREEVIDTSAGDSTSAATRFNRRKSGSRGLLFYRLMQQAVATTPKPAKLIIGGRPQPAS